MWPCSRRVCPPARVAPFASVPARPSVSDERGKPVLAIQVSMEISHQDTLRRELEPLVSTATYFGTQENLIITVNQERRFDEGGVVVHALPAWQWMLQDNPFTD